MRMIDRLLVAALVTREDNPANRREVLLELSPQGRRLVRKVTARRRAEIASIVSAIPLDRRDELIEALRLFAQAAGEPDPQSEDAGNLGW
jgi:DNA-binding MarR family transcriptional regulator